MTSCSTTDDEYVLLGVAGKQQVGEEEHRLVEIYTFSLSESAEKREMGEGIGVNKAPGIIRELAAQCVTAF